MAGKIMLATGIGENLSSIGDLFYNVPERSGQDISDPAEKCPPQQL